jgi:hypothetical protein
VRREQERLRGGKELLGSVHGMEMRVDGPVF